jgi:Flp pilus assembly protein TadD
LAGDDFNWRAENTAFPDINIHLVERKAGRRMRLSTQTALAILLIGATGQGLQWGAHDSEAAEPQSRNSARRQRSIPPAVAHAGDTADTGDPIERELLFNRAVATAKTGDLSSALAITEQNPSSDTFLAYQHAVLLLRTGNTQQALDELSRVAAEPNAPPEVLLDLSLAQLQAGNSAQAESTVRDYLRRHPADAHAQHVLGVVLLSQQRRDEAADVFKLAGTDQATVQRLMLAAHSSTESQPAEGQVLATDDPAMSAAACGPPADACAPPPRRWNLSWLNAYEYDTNVPSLARFEGLGDEVDRYDSRWVTALFGEYRFIQEPDWTLGLTGSVFEGWQFDLHDFSVQDYSGGAYTNYAWGDFLAGINYQYHTTYLGNEHLADDHRLVPTLSYLGYDWGHTTVYFEYDTASSSAPFLIPAQIQSGDANAVGVTQALYTFGGNGRIYAGYRFENFAGEGDDFDRDTHMVTGRIEHPLGWGWIGDVEGRYFWDDYKNPHSLDFFERARSDQRLEFRAGLQRNLNLHWTVRLDYTFIDTNSNVENLFGVNFFEFDRHIVSSQLIYTF